MTFFQNWYFSKPKVTMTSLCLTAAPDCCNGQSKGRYGKRERSILVIVVAPKCLFFIEQIHEKGSQEYVCILGPIHIIRYKL